MSAIFLASTFVTAGGGGTSVKTLRRSKKLSILLKSSTSTPRFATVPFAACQRRCYHDSCRGLRKKSHYEENTDSRKDDFGRGKYLKVNVSVKTGIKAA